MASLETPVCDFGWSAPEFDLLGVDEKRWRLADVRGEKGTLVMFICNHCPYVKAILPRLVEELKLLKLLGINSIGIMSNDPTDYPEDSFSNMRTISAQYGFSFPYVLDLDQRIAKAYGAVCTPDFFGFNSDLKLQYRGRFDASRKESAPSDVKRDLLEAMKLIAETGRGPEAQIPSMGCSIKWINAS